MTNMSRHLASLALAVAFAGVTPLAASGQPKGAEAPLEAGLDGGLSLFKSLRASWRQEVVDPLARTQATRALRQLSNALDDLALEKQELADAISVAVERKKFDALHNNAQELSETVWALRRRLRKVFRFLPAAKQAEGGKVEAQIQVGMSTKWESMNAVAKELALSNPAIADVRAQTDRMVRLTLDMKAQVDSLITELQAGAGR